MNAVQAANGVMTLKDLSDYAAVMRPTAQITYRDFRLFAVGAPASGAVALSALKTVEGYDSMGSWDALNISTHRLDEALRFAYGERGALGDPMFVHGMQEYEELMLNAATAADRRAKISDSHTLNVSDYNPEGYEVLEDHGTSQCLSTRQQPVSSAIIQKRKPCKRRAKSSPRDESSGSPGRHTGDVARRSRNETSADTKEVRNNDRGQRQAGMEHRRRAFATEATPMRSPASKRWC